MITFIHISDSHLGFTENDMTDENGYNTREQDFYNAFTQAVDIILREKPDFVLHTGDIFHRSAPVSRALIFAAGEIKRITDAGIPFYMIAGNHDYPRNVLTAPIHSLYEMINNVTIACSEQLEIIETPGYILHLLPQINNEEKFKPEIDKISVTDSSRVNILAMHLSFGNYLMEEFGERVFPEDKKDLLKPFDYVAMGHWHEFQKMEKYGNVWYAGSTERTAVTQTGYDMGVVKVTIDTNTRVELLPIKLRTYAKITVKNCAEKSEKEICDEITGELKNHHVPGGMFHVLLDKVNASQQIFFTRAKIAELIPGALYTELKKEPLDAGEMITGEAGTEALKDLFKSHLQTQLNTEDHGRASAIIMEIWNAIEDEEAENADN